jgi:NAD(P)-dependent dehydrogenase (short-subunit alcohol dehydrogenase family)
MADVLMQGASGEIGQALVRLFRQEGWRVLADVHDLSRISDGTDFTYPFNATIQVTITERKYWLRN